MPLDFLYIKKYFGRNSDLGTPLVGFTSSHYFLSRKQMCNKIARMSDFWFAISCVLVETLRGHISSATWRWKVPGGFLDAPRFPLQKSILGEKVTRVLLLGCFTCAYYFLFKETEVP